MKLDTDLDCTFRPANPDDVARLSEMAQQCWMEVYGDKVAAFSVNRFWNEEGARRYVDDYLATTVVAVVNNLPVGMVAVTDGFITGLHVVPDYRGCLIGTALLHNAHLDGGRMLEVSAFNERAILFYEKRGWRKVWSFWEDVFGTVCDAMLMVYDARASLQRDR